MKMSQKNSEQTTAVAAGSPVRDKANLLILLCAPSHDRLTEFTCKLFIDFPNLGAPAKFFKIERPITYEQLLSTLSLGQDAEVALIFSGHGDSTSLLCPGVNPESPDYEKSFSCFYDNTFLNLGPTYMLAFCCSAASSLGESFQGVAGRTFMGFDVPIG